MLTVPEELFIGYIYSSDETQAYSGGDICPNEKARATRIKGITGRTNTQIVAKNIPLPGFTLLEPETKWHGKKDYWGIIDPRGFKFTISGKNLACIISCTGITEGLIQERCVWGYDSGELVLLPANSAPYLEATKNTGILNKRVYLRDLQLGDTVLTHKKVQAVYLGTWRTFWAPGWSDSVVDYSGDSKNVVFRILDDSDKITGYYLASSVKISEVINKVSTPLLPADIFEELNTAVVSKVPFTDNDAHDRNNPRQGWLRPTFFTKNNKHNITIDLKEVSMQEFGDAFRIATGKNTKLCYAILPPEPSNPDGILCVATHYVVHPAPLPAILDPEITFDVVHDFNKEAGVTQLLTQTRTAHRARHIPCKRVVNLTECERYYILERTFDNFTF